MFDSWKLLKILKENKITKIPLKYEKNYNT